MFVVAVLSKSNMYMSLKVISFGSGVGWHCNVYVCTLFGMRKTSIYRPVEKIANNAIDCLILLDPFDYKAFIVILTSDLGLLMS